MRLAIAAVLFAATAAGCGGHAGPPADSPTVAALAATRWVPAHPTYLLASPALGDAQHSLRDAIELLGIAAGFDLPDVVAALTGLVGVDALHADPLAAIGVDPRGSWAMFSEDLSPTFVVRLSAPDRMAAFLDHQRTRGLVTRSVIVDQIEVFSAELPAGVSLGWAIAGEWMWLHAQLGGARDDTAWFTASHGAHDAGWSANWAWAQRAASSAAGVVGVLDLHGVLARAAARAPDVVACAKLAEPIRRVAISIDGDDRQLGARIALDVGPTDAIQRMIVPPPSGWGATAARAAIAGQWNLDLAAARPWIAPCLALAGGALGAFDASGLRTARGLLIDLDPDQLTGSGAIAFDLASSAYLEHQLDRIPLRRTLERSQTFGPYHGKSINIPFSVTVEYVLEHNVALAALGEGLLAQIIGTGPGPTRAPVFALDLAPPAMSPHAWEAVLHVLGGHDLTGTPGPATQRAAARLLRWREGHLALTTTPTELVVTATATRR